MKTFIISRGSLGDCDYSVFGVMKGTEDEVSSYVNKANEALFNENYGCSSIDEREWENHNHRHDAVLFMVSNFFSYEEVPTLTLDLPLRPFMHLQRNK